MIVGRILAFALALAAACPLAAAERIFATSQDGNKVTEIIDGGARTLDFASLPGPAAIAATPDGQRLYLTHPDHGTISVVDTSTLKTIARFTYPGVPFGIAFDAAANWLLVADWNRDLLSSLDPTSGKVLREVPTGRSPAHIVLDSIITEFSYANVRATMSVSMISERLPQSNISRSVKRPTLSLMRRRRSASMSPTSAATMSA